MLKVMSIIKLYHALPYEAKETKHNKKSVGVRLPAYPRSFYYVHHFTVFALRVGVFRVVVLLVPVRLVFARVVVRLRVVVVPLLAALVRVVVARRVVVFGMSTSYTSSSVPFT